MRRNKLSVSCMFHAYIMMDLFNRSVQMLLYMFVGSLSLSLSRVCAHIFVDAPLVKGGKTRREVSQGQISSTETCSCQQHGCVCTEHFVTIQALSTGGVWSSEALDNTIVKQTSFSFCFEFKIEERQSST